MNQFSVIQGSVQGTFHRQRHLNNQDGVAVHVSPNQVIGVVCDGCGSGECSEVGAKLGAEWTVAALRKSFPYGDSYWRLVEQRIKSSILTAADPMTGTLPKNLLPVILSKYFLFTVVGFYITPENTYIFNIGDGLAFLNGHTYEFEPLEGNMPAYPAYGIYEPKDFPMDKVKFDVVLLPTEMVETIGVATDGANEFKEKHDVVLPRKKGSIGKIEQFWKDESYFSNPSKLQRKLNVINPSKDVVSADWDRKEISKYTGSLSDDTSLVLARKKQP